MSAILVHTALLRGLTPPEDVDGWPVHTWSQTADLHALESTLGDGPILFHTTLQGARYTRNHKATLPRIHTGLVLPDTFLTAHALQGLLGPLSLNPRALYAPFGALRELEENLIAALGPDLFVRPNSSMKEFTGRPIPKGDWAHELNAIAAIDAPSPDTLCLIAPTQDIVQPEWRCWCVEGQVATAAPYWFDADPDPEQTLPDDLPALAQQAAERMIHVDSLMVIDVVRRADGAPRVVEANGFSTSGFYPGVDFQALWRAARTVWE